MGELTAFAVAADEDSCLKLPSSSSSSDGWIAVACRKKPSECSVPSVTTKTPSSQDKDKDKVGKQITTKWQVNRDKCISEVVTATIPQFLVELTELSIQQILFFNPYSEQVVARAENVNGKVTSIVFLAGKSVSSLG